MSDNEDNGDSGEPEPGKDVLRPGERLSRLSLDSLKQRLSWVRKDREAFRQESRERVEEIKQRSPYRSPVFILAFTVVLVGLAGFLIWLFPPQIPHLEVLDFGLPDIPEEPDAGPEDAGAEELDAGVDAAPPQKVRRYPRPGMTEATEMTDELPELPEDLDDPIGGLDNLR